MLLPLRRPTPPVDVLPPFSPEARDRLERFVPPFRFTSFFSPEDTLLCVLAAEAALAALPRAAGASAAASPHVVELTAGSGLVGFRLLDVAPTATLLGVDVDPAAPPVARENARVLGVEGRARFTCLSVWDAECEALLGERRVDVLICNPPYIPEPPDARLALEAGSGADGAAHLRRVAQLAERHRPRTVALSWCSLGDPVGVTVEMEAAGYRLDALYAVAIADGEYSGLVQPYLETLPTAFLNGTDTTRAAMASDGAARFAYVLLAGVWVDDPQRIARGRGARAAAPAVAELMDDFTAHGLPALAAPNLPCAYRGWLLDRWDELALRAALHGPAAAPAPEPAPSGGA